MKECIGSYFIKNGKKLPVEDFDDKMIYEGESIYEVLRMVGETPLFFKDHYNRLVNSVLNRKKTILSNYDDLRENIKTLAKTGKPNEVNLKIVFNYNNEKTNHLIYFIKASYPSERQYKEGVKGILFRAERNDPASKVVHKELKLLVESALFSENTHEALLVNDQNLITEGSRSNIFFIKNNIVYTAPDNLVLGGITRKRLINLCVENGIVLRYECVNADEIGEFDSVLMSGTSPILLPFKYVDNFSFDVANPLIEKLRSMFMRQAEQSVNDFNADLLT